MKILLLVCLLTSVCYPANVIIHWTWTGDDINSGLSRGIEVRCVPAANGPIDTELEWQNAYVFGGHHPVPKPAGTRDSLIVSNLSVNASYYFAAKIFDEVPNYSGLSNSIIRPTRVIKTPTMLEWR